MTFHKLVKKIYEECLHSHCETNIATDEEIQKCIDWVKQGKVNLKFKAIFIDEVQIFDPLYLELCYSLLEEDEDRVFLMAGDLNQAVRALSRKGDAPWKRINGVHLVLQDVFAISKRTIGTVRKSENTFLICCSI